MKRRAFNMPFKSQAQRAKFEELVKQGKMSQETFNKWEAATPPGELPERVGEKQNKTIKTIKRVKVLK